YVKRHYNLPKLDSVKVIVNTMQTIKTPNNESIASGGECTNNMTTKPLSTYQQGEISFDLKDMPTIDKQLEMYIVDDLMYVYESELDEWVKMEEEAENMLNI